MKTRIYVAEAILLSIAAMGLVFHTSYEGYVYVYRDFFLQTGLGLFACTAAALLGWKRCLRIAPWLFGIAVASALLAVMLNITNFKAVYFPFEIPTVGEVGIEAQFILPFSLILFGAWLVEEKGFAVSRVLMFMAGVALAYMALRISFSDGFGERMQVFFTSKSHGRYDNWMASYMHEGFRKALFVGAAPRYWPDVLPSSRTDSMLAYAVTTFGKWFVWELGILVAAFAAIVVSVARNVASSAKKMYLALFALWFAGPFFLNLAMCFGVLPVIGTAIPVCSFANTLALLAYGGFGIAVAAAQEP